MYRITITVFFLLTLGVEVHAQKVWTLEECIKYAYDQNLDIKQSTLGVLGGQLDLRDARFESLPNLNASTSFTNNTGRSVNPFTNIIEDQDINGQNLNLSANVTVFDGFRIRNNVKRNMAELDALSHDLENAKNNLALDVVTFFTNIIFNDELLNAARYRLEFSTIQLENSQKQFDAGAIPRANLLQAKQQKAADELEVVRAENNLILAKLRLKQALLLPAGEEFEIDIPDLPDPEAMGMDMELSNIFAIAENLQPIIKAADTRVESAIYGIKVAKANYYPSVSINAGLGSAYSSIAPEFFPAAGSPNETITTPIGFVEGTNQIVLAPQSVPVNLQENTYWNQLDFNLRRFVGISLNVPIFNKFQVKNNVARSKIGLERAEINSSNVRLQLRQAIEQAFWDAKASAKAFDATKNSLEALEESFRNVQQRFELGASNVVEYNQIRNDYARVQSDMIRAKYDYIFKLKILDFYQGKPLTF